VEIALDDYMRSVVLLVLLVRKSSTSASVLEATVELTSYISFMVCCCLCYKLRYAAKLDDILPPCVLTDDDLSDSEDYDGKHFYYTYIVQHIHLNLKQRTVQHTCNRHGIHYSWVAALAQVCVYRINEIVSFLLAMGMLRCSVLYVSDSRLRLCHAFVTAFNILPAVSSEEVTSSIEALL
jgi:hypothetical protein